MRVLLGRKKIRFPAFFKMKNIEIKQKTQSGAIYNEKDLMAKKMHDSKILWRLTTRSA